MLGKLFEIWERWCNKGIMLPFGYDPETQKPSITLIFFWITSILSVLSLIALHFNFVTYTSTGVSLLFVVIGFVMYRLRKLDKVKIDVKNQSIDLENNEEKENK